MLSASERRGNLRGVNFKAKLLQWYFGMEEERQLEQTDRKRMRSSSTSIRCDIRLRSSFGSADQSAAAMDAVEKVWDLNLLSSSASFSEQP